MRSLVLVALQQPRKDQSWTKERLPLLDARSSMQAALGYVNSLGDCLLGELGGAVQEVEPGESSNRRSFRVLPVNNNHTSASLFWTARSRSGRSCRRLWRPVTRLLQACELEERGAKLLWGLEASDM